MVLEIDINIVTITGKRYIYLLIWLVKAYVIKFQQTGNLSEWLRRKIRNLLGFARAGSSPAVVVINLFFSLALIFLFFFFTGVHTLLVSILVHDPIERKNFTIFLNKKTNL